MQHTQLTFKSFVVRLVLPFLMLSFLAVAPASAGDTKEGSWVNKKYSIAGSWSIEKKGDQHVIVFSEDFATQGGPDLKVFLSPQSIEEVTGRTATTDSILISALQNVSGSQKYVLPASIDINQFKSLLIHCEAYSVLWGGSNL